MMKHFSSTLLFTLMIIACCTTYSCKKTPAPNTCFSGLPDSAYVGQTITFMSCTNGASSYLWVFGDGATASTANATHAYSTPGIYKGTFTSSNGLGDTKAFTIVVTRPYNTWTFQGMTDTSYAAAGVGGDTLQTSNFSPANLNNSSNVVFVFSSLPATSGSYQLVNDQFATPGAMQMAVYLTTPSGRNYGSTGSGNSSATVTVNGGKVKVSFPAVEMVNLANPADSASLSATVVQTE